LLPFDTLPLKIGKLCVLISPEMFAALFLSICACETCVILLERSFSSSPSTSALVKAGGVVLLLKALTTVFLRLPKYSMNINIINNVLRRINAVH
jgi:hypothetical protein